MSIEPARPRRNRLQDERGYAKDRLDSHLEVHIPKLLRSLSEEEVDGLYKAVTGKVDLLLLAILILLFLLCIASLR